MDRLGDVCFFGGLDDFSAEVNLGSTYLMDAQKIVFFKQIYILIDKGGALILFFYLII
jgi:hypothetical protein